MNHRGGKEHFLNSLPLSVPLIIIIHTKGIQSSLLFILLSIITLRYLHVLFILLEYGVLYYKNVLLCCLFHFSGKL